MKLRLVLDVEYEPHRTSRKELEDNLEAIVTDAMNRGWDHWETEAEVVSHKYDIQTLEK